MKELRPPHPGTWTAVRLARPARDLTRSARFYGDLIGLTPLGGFENHDGYDGVFFALPGGAELELTAGPAQPAPPRTRISWSCSSGPGPRWRPSAPA